MDYNSLTASSTSAGSIAGWLNSQQLQAVSSNILEEAQSYIYRRLRHWRMLTSTTGTLGSNTAVLPFPSDFLEDKTFYFTGTAFQRITRKPIQEVLASYCYDGSGNRVQCQPQVFFNDQSNLNFDSVTDATYPFLLYYYQQPAPLSSTNTTNFLTNNLQRLVRSACMTAAAEYMKDSGTGNYDRTYWAQMTEQELDAAQRESDRQEHTTDAGMQLT